jgi:AraC family transcriptional regulator
MAASVPVSLGAEGIRQAVVPGFRLAELRFPPALTLAPHDHDRTTLAVVMEGGFDGWWAGREGACPPGALLVEPAGERHANRFAAGATTRVLIVQPEGDTPWLGGARGRARLRPDAVLLAWRIGEELRRPDAVTPVALEGLALELTALAARSEAPRPAIGSWVTRARDIVEERYAEPVTLSWLAAELQVHPSQLARAFRRQHGRPVGTYLREVRIRRAAVRLARSSEPIASVAVAVGFADQSHLTRWFVRHVGVTPARYRAIVRDPSS